MTTAEIPLSEYDCDMLGLQMFALEPFPEPDLPLPVKRINKAEDALASLEIEVARWQASELKKETPRLWVQPLPQRVGYSRGLTMKIWADEHPPPHFHVDYQGEGASFSILTCKRLEGTSGLERYERGIRKWWKENKAHLIEVWNRSRPANCPVGPITV